MTNNTQSNRETNTTEPSTGKKSLHLIPTTKTEEELLTYLTEIINPLFSTDAVIEVTSHETHDWAEDTPCPDCGSSEIRVIRAREEEYRYNNSRNELEYEGTATETATLAGTPLRVFCPACHTIHLDTPQYHLNDYRTL